VEFTLPPPPPHADSDNVMPAAVAIAMERPEALIDERVFRTD
jgi:hypothetical protein